MVTPEQVFTELTAGRSSFSDGRINFTGVKKAPVINIVCYCKGELLILKRSKKVSSYQSLWNGVSGFIDERKPLQEFVTQELTEELGISSNPEVFFASLYEVEDTSIDRI